ncbi:MAG: hypothetical protein ACF8QF_13130 [Phycisphaerales bacterium]
MCSANSLRLALPAALCAIACFDARAEVIYVDIPDRTVDRIPVQLDLDMNGAMDFSVFRTDNVATSIFGTNENNLTRRDSGSQFASYLVAGDGIGPGPGYDQLALLAQEICESGGCSWFGPFPQSGQTGFVGVEFLIDGATHYGWIRLHVARVSGVATIFDYAYQATPDVGINAGQVPSPGAVAGFGFAGLLAGTRRRR